MARLEDVILLDTRANQPASADTPVGVLFCVTDEDNIIERNNGTTWDAYSPTTVGPTTAQLTRQIGITVDGGGAVITTGVKGYRSFPVAGTVTGWRLLADIAGDVDFDVLLDAYGSYPPTTIAFSPTMTGVDTDEDTVSEAVAAGDVFGFEITGTPATITRVTLELTIVVT